MAVKPDIDTFLAPNKPFVFRLQSDDLSADVIAELTLKVDGQAREFRIGETGREPTSNKAHKHEVAVNPFFGTKLFIHDWGPSAVGNEVTVTATSQGASLSDTGDVF